MVIVNGRDLTKSDLSKALADYSKYLESILRGDYTLSTQEVKLLDIKVGDNANQKLGSIINKIRSFDVEKDDFAKFDFNADNVADSANTKKDIELLGHIVKSRVAIPKPGLQVYEKSSGEAMPDWAKQITRTDMTTFFKTSGGFIIASGPESQDTGIYDSQGRMMSLIWGDPHVNEFNPETGAHTGQWHYNDDSTFILPDGTKLSMNSLRGSNHVTLNRGLYIKDGDQVATVGMQFAKGRDTKDLTDDTEGETLAKIKIFNNASEWDASTVDAQASGKRNGTFAWVESKNQWAKMDDETGRFKDLNDETWDSYLNRSDDSLAVNSQVKITREQILASLDGKHIKMFENIQKANFGDLQFELEEAFLKNRNKFKEEDINAAVSAKQWGFDSNVILDAFNGSLTGKLKNFFGTFANKPQLDKPEFSSVFKKYIVDSVFYPDKKTSSQGLNDDQTKRAKTLIEYLSLENPSANPFAAQLPAILDASLDLSKNPNQTLSIIKIAKASQAYLLESNGQEKIDFLKALAKRQGLEIPLNSPELSGVKLQYAALFEKAMSKSLDLGHTFAPVYSELVDKLLKPININKHAFNEGELQIVTRRGLGGASSRVQRTSANTASTRLMDGVLGQVQQVLMEEERNFQELSAKTEGAVNLANQRTPADEAFNKSIIRNLYTLQLESFKAKEQEIISKINSFGAGNSGSRILGGTLNNLRNTLYSIQTKISSYQETITKLG
jgi:hypothetical protein